MACCFVTDVPCLKMRVTHNKTC